MTPFVTERIQRVGELLGDPGLTAATVDTLRRMAPDPVNKPALMAWLEDGLERGERRWEIRTALRGLARVLQPRSYLEIGTRRGWSLAQVACEAPGTRVYSVDLWVNDYGGVANPGPEFLREEILRVAPEFRGELHFLSGDSHDLLPRFLDGLAPDDPAGDDLRRHGENRPNRFDLVTVDGDHSALGAWWDLLDVLPHVAVGGAVVFDDLLDCSDEPVGGTPPNRFAERHPPLTPLRPSLLDVWRRIRHRFGNFTYLENLEAKPPLGIAIRTH